MIPLFRPIFSTLTGGRVRVKLREYFTYFGHYHFSIRSHYQREKTIILKENLHNLLEKVFFDLFLPKQPPRKQTET